jgi:uncharacterized protein YndB with AHSA1/START domain/uncharacterized protein YciI
VKVSTVPPIRREVLVPADKATAFDVFTTHIDRWWPVDRLSVHGAGSTVTFIDGEIVEESPNGEQAVWGAVTRWDPPEAVAFTWHPGSPPERSSRVEVTFTESGGRTLVALEHSGWEVFDDPEAARGQYNHGWIMVLDRFAASAGAPSDDPSIQGADDRAEEGDTWVALVHRPGPNAPVGGSIFLDPRFGDHIAFLTRMRQAGYLIAAGPLPDESGAGMTVLRLPGADQLEQAAVLASEDDLSVAGGFFTVTVRPWDVMMHA